MRAQVHIVAAVLIIQDLAVPGHKHGNGIREQEHSRGDRARNAIQPFMTNADILQLNRIHQMMQRYVRVAAAQSREQRSHEAGKSHQWLASKGAEKKVEPHDVRLQLMQGLEEAVDAAWIIERPTAQDRKPLGFDVR